MLDYIQFTSHNTAGHRLRDYTANINSSDIFELPGGPLGFAAGFEHREIDGFVSSDPTVSEGNGTTNVVHSYRGHYHVNAYYGELDIPLLSDLPGADELNVDLAIRESEYSTFPANTSKKAGFKYQPVSDFLLRGSISTGFRAPGINALFAASSQTFPSLTDPCDDYLTSGIPEQAQQICQSQGVPPSYSQQSPILAVSEGGNPHLDAETSLSKTFGFVYSPSWLPGFNISADYYQLIRKSL